MLEDLMRGTLRLFSRSHGIRTEKRARRANRARWTRPPPGCTLKNALFSRTLRMACIREAASAWVSSQRGIGKRCGDSRKQPTYALFLAVVRCVARLGSGLRTAAHA